jgi:glycosyltransferase involved in cell wall biosynthesis
MKIGLVATGIWGSIHLETARELSRLGHSIRIYTEDNRAPSGLHFSRYREDELEFWVIHGVRRNPLTWLPDRLLKYWLGRRFFTTLVAIWRFIRQNRDCDIFVVESDWLGFFVAIAAYFERVQWVVGIHDTDYLDAPIDYPGRPVSRWRTRVQRWVLEQAALVRANSFVTRDALIAGGCSEKKIAVVPLHAPSRMHLPPYEDVKIYRVEARRAWRERYRVPENALLMVTMCRLTPVKRLELAVETLSELRRRGVDAWLVLFGGDRCLPVTGSYAQQLRAIATAGNVADYLVVAGDIPPTDVKQALAAADIHLAPSWVDTFNYAVVEAALVGTPSLVSPSVGAAPWLASAAVIVRDARPDAWASAAIRRRAMTDVDCRELATTLSVESITKQLEIEYGQLVP